MNLLLAYLFIGETSYVNGIKFITFACGISLTSAFFRLLWDHMHFSLKDQKENRQDYIDNLVC